MDTLDLSKLMSEAEHEARASDYGDDSLRNRLSTLVGILQSSGLTADGLVAAHHVIRGLLVSRLRLFADRVRYPVAGERVVRPIIATGEPRSGTTLLQMLLGQEDNSRLVKFWEVMRPSPPPSLAGADDQRRAQADSDWHDILQRIPRWLVCHPYNDMLGAGPPECERLWAMDFRSTPPSAWWRVPLAPIGGLPQDRPAQYRIHKMMLQQLQLGVPLRRWVLKGVTHHYYFSELLETYPDAIIIWIHRDPVQTVASRFELIAQIIEGIAGSCDRIAFAEASLEAARSSFASLATARQADDPRVNHVLYKDFTKDPVALIRSIFHKRDLPFSSGTEMRMKAWISSNRSDRYGRFSYSPDLCGLSLDALSSEFRAYRERFGIPAEAA
ncbi:MAG TPA: sulfotransferase [Steroidobacteraceae bacterium]|jgi:hypothetical protein